MPSELTLSLFIGPATAVVPAPAPVLEAVTDINVHSAAFGKSGFEIKLATSTRSPITQAMLPAGYFDPPARVVIVVTAGAVATVLMDGVITQHDIAPSNRAGASVLSLKGEDLTRMMDLIPLDGLPYPAMGAAERVLVMLAKYTALYGVVPLVVPEILKDISNPAVKIPQQQGTDLKYIKKLANDTGYTFFLQPGPAPGMNVAYWGPQVRVPLPFVLEPAPFAIDSDGNSNVDSLHFAFDGFKKSLSIAMIQQPNTHVTIPVPIPDVNPLSPPLGTKYPPPLKLERLTGTAKQSALKTIVLGLAKAAEQARVISGGGSLDVLRYGQILSARTVVDVRGAGIAYDGEYFVESVTHAIKPGSYTQSFSLSRNAFIPTPGAVASLAASSIQQQLPALAGAAAVSAAQGGGSVHALALGPNQSAAVSAVQAGANLRGLTLAPRQPATPTRPLALTAVQPAPVQLGVGGRG